MSDISSIPMLTPKENTSIEIQQKNLKLLGEIANSVKTKPLSSKSGSGSNISEQVQENVKDSLQEYQEMEKKIKSSLVTSISNTVSSSVKQAFNNPEFKTALSRQILGPFSLVLSPLNELFGFTGGLKDFFDKRKEKKKEKQEKELQDNLINKKISPKRAVLQKFGVLGAMSVYLGSVLGDGEKEKEGFLDGLFSSGMLSKLGGILPGMLLKMGAIGAIIGSVVWMVADAFKGAKLAKKWGVSKTAGAVGAILGGTSKGLKGALAGMGKWALMGAGIGTLVLPGVGTLIGGLIGAALGGILGFIGGEKIAKFIQGVGNFIVKAVKAIGNFFAGVGKAIWGGIKKARKFVAKVGSMAFNVIKKPFVWIFDFFKGDPNEKKEMIITLGKNIGKFIGKLFYFIMKPIKKIFPFLKRPIEKFKKVMGGIWDFIVNAISNVVEGVAVAREWIKEKILTPIVSFISPIIKPFVRFIDKYMIQPLQKAFTSIVDFFIGIADWFSFVWERISTGDIGGIFDKEKKAKFLQRKKFNRAMKNWADTVNKDYLQVDESNTATNPDYIKFYMKRKDKMTNQAIIEEYMEKKGLPKPKIEDFDIGGKVSANQMAFVRKDEEILSPMESRRYRKTYGSRGQDQNIQNLVDSMNASQTTISNHGQETVMILKQLLSELKNKDMKPTVNTVVSEDMFFNADMYRHKLAY